MANQIEFKLFAPYNKEATLMGGFSDWKEIPTAKDERGYFRAEVDLEDGTYHYKFRVRSKSDFIGFDEWVDVIDPYATEVEPSEQNGVIRIQDGCRIVDTYVWKYDDKPLPSDRELVIYKLHVHDFTGGEDDPYPRGQFKHITEKLDYLNELGINAIELMPVSEYPGDYSWGYNPRHFFAIESSYGSTMELKQLIDGCHKLGIRVFFDCIYNHAEMEHPLTQIDYNYWFSANPTDPDNSWGPEFDYEHYDDNLDVKPAWQYIGDNAEYWIKEYHIDGIRYDAAKQLNNYDFMHWMVDKTKQLAGMKPFYNVAERIPESPEITNYEGPMDGAWHESFSRTLVAHLCGEKFDLASLKDILDGRRQGYLGASNMVNYISVHDRERLMVELGNRGIFHDAAFKRAKLGAVLLMTAVGIPMIWMGEEFGEYKPNTIEPAKLDWRLFKNENNSSLFDYYRGLVQLRRKTHALYTENIEFFHEDEESRIFAYTRWNDEGSRVVVVANFSDNYLAGYTVPNFPAGGTWHEWTRDYEIDTGNNEIILDLPEYEAQVFVNH